VREPIQNLSLWWFDIGVGVWLTLGLFRGRKNGMSGELLLLIKWLLVVVGCSYGYPSFGAVIREYSSFSPEWSNRIAYLGIAFLLAVVLNKIQALVGDKLIGNDFFGGGEYYLGMISGVARYACMVVFLLAFLNARIPTADEVKKFNARTEDLGPAQVNPMKIHRQILLESYTGRVVRGHLSQFLIAPAAVTPAAPPKPVETIAVRKQRMLDEIVGTPAKP
jgi:uncharacterized membrane protein required for colicin V production